MKILVLGASGATGKLVVQRLISMKFNVKVVVRESAIIPSEIAESSLVEINKGNIAEFSDSELADLLKGCSAIVSCLGHNISLKGIFGKPRDLVSRTIRHICTIAEKYKNDKKLKVLLMSTTAYTSTTMGERNSLGERIILSILKLILPPHRDNVLAADYLQNDIRDNNENLEWIAVRPDTLVNKEKVSEYEVYKSPVRSPIFNAGKVSRINVSHFMVALLTDDQSWHEWKFKMPVMYDRSAEK